MDGLMSETEIRMILDAYESSYLYLDEVPSLQERRKMFVARRDRSVDAINAWFRDNARWDDMTKVYCRIAANNRVTFEYPAQSMMMVGTHHIDAVSADRILINLRRMQPDILILDLRGASGDDPQAALSLVSALADGEICTQRYRWHDRTTVSRRISVRPGIIFIFTDRDTKGCAAMAATSLYLSSGKVTVIGMPIEGEPVGRMLIGGMRSDPRLVFSMAAYRWSVQGRGPEIFDYPDPKRFIPCASDTDERMLMVYERARAGGWDV